MSDVFRSAGHTTQKHAGSRQLNIKLRKKNGLNKSLTATQ